jgi:L-ascorbate metabolism protein UlaG (beta-lactamase superfamily)
MAAPNDLMLPGDPTPELDRGTIQFVGTATVIVRYAGFTILTDPNFLHRGDHVHLGWGLTSERLTEPAIAFEDLPPIDLVVLSHLHGDHFDPLVAERLDRGTPIVSTPHAVRALRRMGFRELRALRPWQQLGVRRGRARLVLTATPGRHGPPLLARALPPVMGSLLDFPAEGGDGVAASLFLSGDTLVFDGLREIPRRHPRIDVALLHLGGTRVLGVLVTMDARQGVEALRLLGAGTTIPIHYDDYTVFRSPLEDFAAAVRAAGLEAKVTYLARGETFAFAAPAVRKAA